MSNGKLTIELEPRIDSQGKKFYIGRLCGPFLIDCSEKNGGVAFMIFVSEDGSEEMQISHITNHYRDKDDRR
jgi:hypothetical protein